MIEQILDRPTLIALERKFKHQLPKLNPISAKFNQDCRALKSVLKILEELLKDSKSQPVRLRPVCQILDLGTLHYVQARILQLTAQTKNQERKTQLMLRFNQIDTLNQANNKTLGQLPERATIV